MRIAVCPGSFDPVTMGHLDVFERASRMSDQVIVGVLINKKKSSLFTLEERIEMLTDATAHLPNVSVDSFYGLLVDYCRDHDVDAIVKGLRAVSDFDYELQMAQMNYRLTQVEPALSQRTRFTVIYHQVWSKKWLHTVEMSAAWYRKSC